MSTTLAQQDTVTRDVGGALKDLAAGLQDTVGDRGRSLRSFLVIGAAVAALLLALMLYFALRSRRAAADALRAERQVADILGTVREGLFLLDRNLALGAVHSASLTRILHTEIVSGGAFEDLLRPLVPAKTLATAMKFVNLLWKEKVHEDLIDTVNPLNQIEVRFARTGGGTESRHLSFAFRRVKGGGEKGAHARRQIPTAQIAHELEQSKARPHNSTSSCSCCRCPAPSAGLRARLDMALRKSNAIEQLVAGKRHLPAERRVPRCTRSGRSGRPALTSTAHPPARGRLVALRDARTSTQRFHP